MTTSLKTIVIADDEEGMRRVLTEYVQALGYECLGTAENGSAAIELVRKTRPNVILIDYHMPIVDGVEATRQITALGTTAVILLTGDTDPEVGRKAMDAGACGYMNKPCDGQQIAVILETAWHRFQTVFSLQEKARALDEALEMRKLTEKAKGILMEQQGFSEADAHHCLLKMSQDQGIPLKDVCRSVIQVRMVLGKRSKKAA